MRLASRRRSQPAALGELLDFLKNQRRSVARPGVLVPAAHLGHGVIALRRRRIPVQSLPIRPKELAEGIAHGKAHADPVGPQLLDRWSAQVLRLTDAHPD